MTDKQQRVGKVTRILLGGFISVSGILFGYDTGSISGVLATPDFIHVFGSLDDSGVRQLTSADKSLIVSILSAGTFFGALGAAPLGDFLGRRMAIVFSCLVFMIGIGLQLTTHLAPFVIGRVLAGLGVGATSVLSPCFQAETAPSELRGLLVGLYEGFVTVGLLLAGIINNAVQSYTGHASWRTAIAVQFAFGAIIGGGMFLLPESPRWLVRQGKIDKATKSVSKIRGVMPDDPLVERVLSDITISLEAEGRAGYVALFKPNTDSKILRRTLTAMSLHGLQQLTGINFIFYYGTTFFQASGIRDSFTTSVICGVVNVVCTLPGLWAIDKAGRRKLLFWGAVWMAVCQYVVAIAGITVSASNVVGNRVLIAFVCLYIAGFASTWGPCVWTVTSEAFPLRNRAKGMSISTATNWLFNWAIGYMTPYLVDKAPGSAGLQAKVFFLWGSFCIVCATFVFFCIPETMQLTLEQCDLLWRSTTVRRSDVRRREIMQSESAVQTDLGQNMGLETEESSEIGKSKDQVQHVVLPSSP